MEMLWHELTSGLETGGLAKMLFRVVAAVLLGGLVGLQRNT